MKDIIVHVSSNETSSSELLTQALREVHQMGFAHVFTPYPQAWKANRHFHYDVKKVGEYTRVSATGKSVTIFLFTGYNCRGYCVMNST